MKAKIKTIIAFTIVIAVVVASAILLRKILRYGFMVNPTDLSLIMMLNTISGKNTTMKDTGTFFWSIRITPPNI